MTQKQIHYNIDKIDKEMISLFEKRMYVAKQIGEYKIKKLFIVIAFVLWLKG